MTHGAHDFASLIFGGALLVLGLNCAGSSEPKATTPTTDRPPATVTLAEVDASPPVAATGADAAADAPRSTELRAWFQLRTMKCGKDDPDYGTCYAITLSLHGAVEEERVVAKGFWAQVGCTGGVSVHCDGPSGSSHLSLACTKDGQCIVEDYGVSDGYCPPPEDCGDRVQMDKFTVPVGTKLVFVKP